MKYEIKEGSKVNVSDVSRVYTEFTGDGELVIDRECQIDVYGSVSVLVLSSAEVSLCDESKALVSYDRGVKVQCYDRSYVEGRGEIEVNLFDYSSGVICGGTVYLHDDSSCLVLLDGVAHAHSRAFVVGADSSSITLNDLSIGILRDRACGSTYKNARIIACDESVVYCYGLSKAFLTDRSLGIVHDHTVSIAGIDNAKIEIETDRINQIFTGSKVKVDCHKNPYFKKNDMGKFNLYQFLFGSKECRYRVDQKFTLYRSIARYHECSGRKVMKVDIKNGRYFVGGFDKHSVLFDLYPKNAFVIQNRETGYLEWFDAAIDQSDAIEQFQEEVGGNFVMNPDNYTVYNIKHHQLENLKYHYVDGCDRDTIHYFEIIKKINDNRLKELDTEDIDFLIDQAKEHNLFASTYCQKAFFPGIEEGYLIKESMIVGIKDDICVVIPVSRI